MDVELQSRLESLFKSNEPPSSRDVPLITEFLRDRLAHISELEQQLVKFRMETKIYEGLLSGIRKLPPELLIEIFTHYVPSCREGRSNFSAYYTFYPRPTADGPIRIGQVCRKWRLICLSTPMLWNFISLPHRTPFGCINYAALVEHCITNSRVSPLYITLSIFGSSERYRTPAARSLKYSGTLDTLDKFMPEISRWRHFHFDMFTTRSMLLERKFPPIPPTGAPNMLEIFFRAITTDHDTLEVAWALQLIRSSSNLRKISFIAPIWDLEIAPWPSLKHFESKQGMRLKDLFLVFRGCPLLQYCEVCFELEQEPPSIPSFNESGSIIVLSELKTLQLTHLRQAELSTLLQWITVPALKELTLAGHHVSDTWQDALFRSFLSRSACKLHTLSLSRFSYSDDNIMDYLRLPNVHDTLEALEIDKWKTPISPELLNFLTFKFSDWEASSSLILPKLKNVAFAIHAIVQAVRLREFFLSRWYEPARSQAPYPVEALQRIEILLLVPYLPNATVSCDHIHNMFSRIEDVVDIHLETCVVDGGTDYPEIEKLAELDRI